MYFNDIYLSIYIYLTYIGKLTIIPCKSVKNGESLSFSISWMGQALLGEGL